MAINVFTLWNTHRMVGSLISKSLNEVTFTTVLLCLVSLYERTTAAVVHGEMYRGPFVRVVGIIGQQQCVRECRHRPKLCRGVNYQKQELLCDLMSAINETESKYDYVRIELDQTDHVPDECLSCSTDDLCVTLSSKKVHCIRALLGLALGKHTKQSSTHRAYGAEYAVDGNRGTHISQDKCTHTGVGHTNPWWRVDLLTVYSIKSVRILNRGIDNLGDFSNRLRDVTVTVGLTESDVSTPCGFFAGPGTASQLVVIDCPTSPQGRFVKVSKTTEVLTLCVVDVFGVSV
ncbi:uncharacterized protein LOC128174580 [Crassostrea angulata]|uniref:uncharacterized protein LOC128174580 n=1 Tax=Magallana angulata TaxID=2784310 RepID=UPI0022B13BA6|nr:uncharacterized protein LOC128174580 [Crassostrea angulata]